MGERNDCVCIVITKQKRKQTRHIRGWLMLAKAVLYMVILYQRVHVHESESSTTNALFMTAIQNVDMLLWRVYNAIKRVIK